MVQKVPKRLFVIAESYNFVIVQPILLPDEKETTKAIYYQSGQ